MSTLLKRAQSAARLILGSAHGAQHVETLPTGEQVFAVSSDQTGPVTVTLNPNGVKAAVEWPSGYKICTLEPGQELP